MGSVVTGGSSKNGWWRTVAGPGRPVKPPPTQRQLASGLAATGLAATGLAATGLAAPRLQGL